MAILTDENVAVGRDDLVAIARGLGMPTNGIELVSSSDLVRWCVLCSAVWARAREQGTQAELANPIALGDAMHAEMERRTNEAMAKFARAGVPAVFQANSSYWK